MVGCLCVCLCAETQKKLVRHQHSEICLPACLPAFLQTIVTNGELVVRLKKSMASHSK